MDSVTRKGPDENELYEDRLWRNGNSGYDDVHRRHLEYAY